MIERIPIDSIVVGERRRQDLGDIPSLARSINDHGLIQPIVVNADNILVAGERRLRAHEHLGLKDIEARRWHLLTEEERREIELAENLNRKDLTAAERSRQMMALADVAEEIDRAEFRADSARNGHGRPTEPGSLRRVSERTGVAVKTLHDAKRHVAAVETYPVLEKPDWKQYQALEAKEKLDALPEDERASVAALIDQPGIPPKDAIGIIGNLAGMAPKERATVLDLAASKDSRDRQRALTVAASLPPMPDPRSTVLNGVIVDLRKAARMFPDDPFAPQIEAVIPMVKAVVAALDAAYQEAKRADTVS